MNTIYILFEFLELVHSLTEGISEHEEEENPHDFDPNYKFYGLRVLSIRIALMSILIFWTLRDVSLIKKIEDIVEKNFPRYERIFSETDEDATDKFRSDQTLRN